MPAHRSEPLGKVRTKIVATLGPASRDPETLRTLVDAGVDVFRLNFSHGSHDEHSETLRRVRTAAAEFGRNIAVLQDLGGPKIRLGPLPGDAVECHLGDEFELVTDRTADDPHQFTCTYRDLVADLTAGDDLYFADGTVAMVVTERKPRAARLKVTLPGRVRSHQGINLPGANLSVPCLTEKDLRDLDWAAANPVDYIGLSFVRQGSDVTRLRQELDARGVRAKIVAKIEKPQALANLDAIIAATDAVMVARGDLGVEVDVAKVPAIQKKVIAACHRARVPVITATQMLNSMEASNRPTRAEATDVFNAVLDGTDAVMLSGESAVGQYPVAAVETMSRIVTEAESLLIGDPSAPWPAFGARPSGPLPGQAGWVLPVTEAVVEAVRLVARRLDVKLVVVATRSGRTALALSKQRYGPPTLALTGSPEVARSMALYWGVTALVRDGVDNQLATLGFVNDWALGHNLVAKGDPVLFVEGTLPSHAGHNAMVVQVIE